MVDSRQASGTIRELDTRLWELCQRWLPMLLSRAGVPWATTQTLREPMADEQALRQELARCRVAAWRNAEKGGKNVELARSSVALISKIERALDERGVNLARAERSVAQLNLELLGLLVGQTASDDWSNSWWSRIWSRRTAGGAAM